MKNYTSIYLEPKWPLFWRIWPTKGRSTPQNRGSNIWIYIFFQNKNWNRPLTRHHNAPYWRSKRNKGNKEVFKFCPLLRMGGLDGETTQSDLFHAPSFLNVSSLLVKRVASSSKHFGPRFWKKMAIFLHAEAKLLQALSTLQTMAETKLELKSRRASIHPFFAVLSLLLLPRRQKRRGWCTGTA